jgi:hypothetical protein
MFKDRLQDLKDKWFLTEPAYFMILCTHEIVMSTGMKCPIAVGGGIIYINEKYYEGKSDRFLEETIKMELIRILLKHPYQRQLPHRVKMYMASNFVLANNMKLSEVKLKTTREFFGNYGFDRESLEAIYDAIKFPKSNEGGEGDDDKQGKKGLKGKGSGKSGKGDKSNEDGEGGNGDPLSGFDDACNSTDEAMERTQFWKEDDYRTVEINNMIGKIDASNSWGTVPGNVVDTIKKSLIPKFNYKALFQQFRSTIVSSKYTKTRMRPSRRFGYEAMGAKRSNTTSLLVAVDTSGSISDKDLQHALGWIQNFFDYAVERLDVIQFDTQIYPESLVKLSKRPEHFKVKGRGGTDFNDVFNYVQNESKEHYDGFLILTDGYASVPHAKYLSKNFGHTRYMWVLNSESTWKSFKEQKDFLKFGKCTYIATDA